MSRENVDPGREKIDTRVATAADLEGLTTTLTAAFEHDPLWTWVFPDPKHLAVWWRFCIGSALRYPCVWITGDYAAASVWIPPDGTELTEEEEERVQSLFGELLGPRAPEALELLERFEASHPRQRSHYYLSLLGTHPDHRGQGTRNGAPCREPPGYGCRGDSCVSGVEQSTQQRALRRDRVQATRRVQHASR